MGIKKFNNYLEEVRKPIPSTDFTSNIKQLENAIKARIGKFTRLGYEPLALAKLGQGMGITYLFNAPFDKAFRVIYAANPNYSGRPTVIAINVWNHLRYLPSGEVHEPDVSIELKQYDMFDPKDFEIIINTIINVIQNPKSGIYQAENYISESRHTTVDEFYQLVSRELNDPNVDVVDLATLNAIANKHGVGIPTAVRVSTKGANARSLKVALEKAKVIVKKGTSSSTGEVKAFGYMSVATKLRQLGASPEEIVYETEYAVKSLTDALQRGAGTSLIIAGKGGVGKTWLVRKSLKGSEGKNWFTISGRITPLSFYTFLFNHRQHGKVLIFDDIDVFSSEDMLNILKAALENTPDRFVTWDASGRTAPKPHNISELEFYEIKDREYLQMVDTGDLSKWKPPARFLFSASIIFITNKPMSEILSNPHLSAVASRALGRVDFDYNDDELIAKMEQVWKQVRPDIPEVTRRAILDLIIAKQRSGALTQLSMRQMTNAFALAGSGKSVREIAKIIGY